MVTDRAIVDLIGITAVAGLISYGIYYFIKTAGFRIDCRIPCGSSRPCFICRVLAKDSRIQATMLRIQIPCRQVLCCFFGCDGVSDETDLEEGSPPSSDNGHSAISQSPLFNARGPIRHMSDYHLRLLKQRPLEQVENPLHIDVSGEKESGVGKKEAKS